MVTCYLADEFRRVFVNNLQPSRGHEQPEAQQRQQQERSTWNPEERESHFLESASAPLRTGCLSPAHVSRSTARLPSPETQRVTSPLPLDPPSGRAWQWYLPLGNQWPRLASHLQTALLFQTSFPGDWQPGGFEGVSQRYLLSSDGGGGNMRNKFLLGRSHSTEFRS